MTLYDFEAFVEAYVISDGPINGLLIGQLHIDHWFIGPSEITFGKTKGKN